MDALLVVRHSDAAWPVEAGGYDVRVAQRSVASDQPPGGRTLLHQIGQPQIRRVVSRSVGDEDRSISGNRDRRRTPDRLAVNFLEPAFYFSGVADRANPASRPPHHTPPPPSPRHAPPLPLTPDTP